MLYVASKVHKTGISINNFFFHQIQNFTYITYRYKEKNCDFLILKKMLVLVISQNQYPLERVSTNATKFYLKTTLTQLVSETREWSKLQKISKTLHRKKRFYSKENSYYNTTLVCDILNSSAVSNVIFLTDTDLFLKRNYL